MPVINANSVDPDQTPRSAVSDLGLHCLQMFHLWELGTNGLTAFFAVIIMALRQEGTST